LDKSTKENDFNEKTNSVSKMVSSFVENRKDNIPKNMSAGFQSGFQSASKKGLTSLAKFIAAEKANSNNEQVRTFLEELENSIGKQLEGKTLKDYQKSAIDEWKAKPGNEQKSTLAYFMEHDQSGKEIILDLPNGN
jgi:predicted ATP-binding protein involved in virulence